MTLVRLGQVSRYRYAPLHDRFLDLGAPIEQVNYLAGHKSMAMTKRYDHANEERYGEAIEALDEAGKTGSAEALAAARWKRT